MARKARPKHVSEEDHHIMADDLRVLACKTWDEGYVCWTASPAKIVFHGGFYSFEHPNEPKESLWKS